MAAHVDERGARPEDCHEVALWATHIHQTSSPRHPGNLANSLEDLPVCVHVALFVTPAQHTHVTPAAHWAVLSAMADKAAAMALSRSRAACW